MGHDILQQLEAERVGAPVRQGPPCPEGELVVERIEAPIVLCGRGRRMPLMMDEVGVHEEFVRLDGGGKRLEYHPRVVLEVALDPRDPRHTEEPTAHCEYHRLAVPKPLPVGGIQQESL